jgi:hypothetical protein
VSMSEACLAIKASGINTRRKSLVGASSCTHGSQRSGRWNPSASYYSLLCRFRLLGSPLLERTGGA